MIVTRVDQLTTCNLKSTTARIYSCTTELRRFYEFGVSTFFSHRQVGVVNDCHRGWNETSCWRDKKESRHLRFSAKQFVFGSKKRGSKIGIDNLLFFEQRKRNGIAVSFAARKIKGLTHLLYLPGASLRLWAPVVCLVSCKRGHSQGSNDGGNKLSCS